MIRVYDGRALEWVDLLLHEEVVQRWRPVGYRIRYELDREPTPGAEPMWQGRLVHDTVSLVVAATPWQPTQQLAEQLLSYLSIRNRIGPSEIFRCTQCQSSWLYRYEYENMYACAVCGKQSHALDLYSCLNKEGRNAAIRKSYGVKVTTTVEIS